MKITFKDNIYKDNEGNEYWARQRNTAKKIISQFNNNYNTMILADEVGMGKTYSALATMAQFIEKKKKVLLIVPAGGILEKKWLGEIENFNKIYLSKNKIKAIITDDLKYGILLTSINKKEYTYLTEKRKEYFIQVIKNWLKNNKNELGITESIRFRKNKELWNSFYKEFPPQKINDFLIDLKNKNKIKIDIKNLTENDETIKEFFLKFITFFSKNSSSYNVIIIKMRTIKDKKVLTQIGESIKEVFSLVVIDEAHNWKNGARGAIDFQKYIAPHIENKLLLTATPVQLHTNELKAIIDYANGNDNANNSKRLFDNSGDLDEAITQCKECSTKFFKEWKKLTEKQQKEINDYVQEKTKVTKTLIEQINDNELNDFLKTVLEYKEKLNSYEKKLNNIVIKHKKPKKIRQYHCGNEFSADKLKFINKHYLYKTTGYANENNQLLSFIGMRAQQLIARKKTQQESVCLLGGINSSYEAFNQYFENKKIKNCNNKYMDFFLNQIRKSQHPKVTATVERAFNNLLLGKKTLIFCERIATQEKIEEELKSKIINTILENGNENQKQFEDITEQIKANILNQLELPIDQSAKQDIKNQCAIISKKISIISSCFKNLNSKLSNITAIDFSNKLLKFIDKKDIYQVDTKSYYIWNTIANSHNKLVNTINGSTKNDTRINRCTGFNSPLAPYILICTAIGSEGIDLHQCCDDIIIHDLPWNPAKLEQKIGRIDRNECLAEKDNETNKIGIPFLDNDYDELQYKILLSRSQMQEILFGDFLKSKSTTKSYNNEKYDEEDEEGNLIEINPDPIEFPNQPEVQPLPQKLIDFLTLDLSVKKN